MTISNPFDILIALAECGTLSAAAERLNMTQPGASKALQRLEAEVGVPLVERGSRGINFTIFGDAVLARAKQIDATIRSTRDELRQLRGVHEGDIAIGVSEVAVVTLLPRVLMRFSPDWGDVLLRIVPSVYPESLIALRQGDLDIAVVTIHQKPPESAEFDYTPLMLSGAAIVARRGHPLAAATSLAELASASWNLGGATGTAYNLLTEAFSALGMGPPKLRQDCLSIAALHTLVASSDLLSVIPVDPRQPAHFLPQGLITIPIREKIFHGLCVYLISRSGTQNTPALRRLCDLFELEAKILHEDLAA